MKTWQEAVMSKDDAIDGYYSVTQEEYDIAGLLEHQTEIAFRAGQESVVDPENLNHKQGFQAALKIVKETIEKYER